MNWVNQFGEFIPAWPAGERRPAPHRTREHAEQSYPEHAPLAGRAARPSLSIVHRRHERAPSPVLQVLPSSPAPSSRTASRRSADTADPSLLAIPPFLRHLHRLTGSFEHRDEQIPFLHAFARPVAPGRAWPLLFDPPPGHPAPAAAYLRDVARAALLALEVFEWTYAAPALNLARQWLRFLDYMLEPDGTFAVSIADTDGEKVYAGAEDHALDAAYALWALASGWRVTGIARYLQLARRAAWAPTGNPKVLAVQALALMEVYAEDPAEGLRRAIIERCDRICASGGPYFRDRADQATVAPAGYYQLLAVARAGGLFSRLDFLHACQSTVTSLVEPMVAHGFYHIYPCLADPQCAADIAPIALGLEQLARTIRRDQCRSLALHCTDWLDGNNPARVAAYERNLGRCADAAQEGELSPYCGAEAAIDAGFLELVRCRLHD